MVWKAFLDGVARVANVVEIPPSVRTAVDTGRLLEAREGILWWVVVLDVIDVLERCCCCCGCCPVL